MTEYIPEPWALAGSPTSPDETVIFSTAVDDWAVVANLGEQPTDTEHSVEDTGRRIVACVNACAGLSDEELQTIADAKHKIDRDEMRRTLAAREAVDAVGVPTAALEDGIIEEMVKMVKVAQGTLENIPKDALGYESDGETQWPLVKEIHSRISGTLAKLDGGDDA